MRFTLRHFILPIALLAGFCIAQVPETVLFVGNSYTFYNDLPGEVTKLAASAVGPKIHSTSVTQGGATLKMHYQSSGAVAAIKQASWDVVVLQGQSVEPLYNPTAFATYAGLLAQEYDPSLAARLGAMVHARAGDICRGEIGRHGMLAGDILRCLPYAWRELETDPEEIGRPSLSDTSDDDDHEGEANQL